MGIKGDDTRRRILQVAERLVLQNGFSGTSIDEVIDQAAITKGGFFYHFSGKRDLAKQMILRYLDEDEQFFSGLLSRSASLTEDPLQQFLLFIKLMAEAMSELPDVHPGCLVASFTYENQQFDDEIRDLVAEGVLSWRRMFQQKLAEVMEKYPPKIEVSAEDEADMFTTVIEGGIMLSRVLNDKDVLPKQLLQYRTYIRLLFDDI